MIDEWDPWNMRKQPHGDIFDMNGNWVIEQPEDDDESADFRSVMAFAITERERYECPHCTGEGVRLCEQSGEKTECAVCKGKGVL